MLRDKLMEELKTAMKARDKVRLDALRYVLSLVKNAEIDKKADLNDEEVMKLIQSEVKKRREAIEQMKVGGREDLVKIEEDKLKVLGEFLPEQMSEGEIERIVSEAVSTGESNFGGIMRLVIEQVRGRAGGKLVAEIVKRKLGE